MSEEATIIQLRTFSDTRGKLTVAEELPFEVKRAFWLWEPTGLPRGGHAHKECHQMIVALHGSFAVILDGDKPVRLTTPHFGAYVPPGIVVTLDDWAAGSVALVLCSEKYDAEDYIE